MLGSSSRETGQVRPGRKPHGYYHYGLLLWDDMAKRAPAKGEILPRPVRKPAQVLNLAAYVHEKREPGFAPASQGDVIDALRKIGLTYIAEFLVKLGVDVSAPLPPNPESRVGGSHLLGRFYQKLDAPIARALSTFPGLPANQRVGLMPLVWHVSMNHSVAIGEQTSFLTGYALVTEADTPASKAAERLGRVWNKHYQEELEELQSFERENGFGEIWLYKAFPRAIEWLDEQIGAAGSRCLDELKWLEVLGRGRVFTPAFERSWLSAM